jgi:hypothetical protein
MLDQGSPEAGATIDVLGNVNAQGTADDPIFFFPTEGAPALELVAGNYSAYRGIYHDGANTSYYSHVFFTGGGNGTVGTYHLYPPMLRFWNGHSLEMSDCVMADSAATSIDADYGGGTLNVSNSLLARLGIGAKFGVNYTPRAHMTVTFEDTWFVRIGRGVESLELDGDAIHWDSDSDQGLTLRRCIVTDIGDDAVDGSDEFYMKTFFESCIVYDIDDKLTTYWPGDAYANNLLLFACNKGFESVNGFPTQSTLADHHPFPWEYGGDWWANSCIVAPSGTDDLPGETYSCSRFHANYTLLANSAHVGCGTANLVGDPLYIDPMTGGFPPAPGDYKSSYDYNLQPGSPALTAGPSGERIGWLGFPEAEPCSTDAECGNGGLYDDGNPCTADACVVRVCEHSLLPDCIACFSNGDCDYGDASVVGTCEVDGTCSFSSDICVEDSDCDDLNVCTDDTCVDGDCQNTFNSAPCDDGLFCTENEACAEGVCTGGNARDCSSLTNQCNTGVCNEVADACEAQPVADGTACPDGQYCNGDETCQAGVCVTGAEPCVDPCEQCDEDADTCAWCIFDLDGNGYIASGDFGGFAGCYGQCYSPGDPCLATNFDGSPDGCVGSGDFGGFAGCYGKECAACANCFPAPR